MAELSSKQRKALPKSDFALPGNRFPIENRAHAANAKSRAAQGVKAGTLSEADRAKIDKKADAKLGKKDEKKKGGK